jgi:hypothetical protein
MRTAIACRLVLVLALSLLANVGWRGGLGPSCKGESGPVFSTEGLVAAGQTDTYSVVSPKSSNLLMRLMWTEAAATLGLRASCPRP